MSQTRAQNAQSHSALTFTACTAHEGGKKDEGWYESDSPSPCPLALVYRPQPWRCMCIPRMVPSMNLLEEVPRVVARRGVEPHRHSLLVRFQQFSAVFNSFQQCSDGISHNQHVTSARHLSTTNQISFYYVATHHPCLLSSSISS